MRKFWETVGGGQRVTSEFLQQREFVRIGGSVERQKGVAGLHHPNITVLGPSFEHGCTAEHLVSMPACCCVTKSIYDLVGG